MTSLEYINIAISSALRANTLAKLLEKIQIKFPKLNFVRVNYDDIEKYKDVDAWINPGSADSFPRNNKEFNLSTWWYKPNKLELEYLYQEVLDITFKNNIPYFGICGGAQHLALYHGASMKAVKGYADNLHEIYYDSLSLSLFYTMSLDEQKEALYNCKFASMVTTAQTFNNYAVISDKSGDLELGATAHDADVAMAYAHKNGIRYGTQYHLELFYGEDKKQTNIVDNFIKQAFINSAYKRGEFFSPIDIYAQISQRIDECKISPTSDFQFNEEICLYPPSLFELSYQSYFDFNL